MESLTKNKQSEQIITKMVTAAFKAVDIATVEELCQGYFNVAYFIKLSDGREVILKIAPKADIPVMIYEHNIMYTEVETMRLVKQQTDIPVAEVLYYDNSHTICEEDYFFMTKLEGESYATIKSTLSEEQKSNIEYQLGVINAKINAIRGTEFGYYALTMKHNKNWYQAFSEMINDVLVDGEKANTNIGMAYTTIRELLHKHQSAFDEVKVPCLVHWDLWPGNVFVKDGKVSGIIDFERCRWADPLMEYGFRSLGANKDFYRGYGVNEFTQKQSMRILWYDLYLHLVMTIECDYRQYEDDTQYIKSKQKLANDIRLLTDYI